jgi:hypothetical protein
MICDFCLKTRSDITSGTGAITTVHICNDCVNKIALKIRNQKIEERPLMQRVLHFMFGN